MAGPANCRELKKLICVNDDSMGPEIITATLAEIDDGQACQLRAQARRCRRLADAMSDARTITTLNGMAAEYEAQARALRPA
jgi:hypothetical protein